jgi:hypothetical protein
MAKASLKNLTTATHKGRKSRGMGSRPNPLGPGGQRGSGLRLKADPRLTMALGGVSPTPKGPYKGGVGSGMEY